MNDNNRTVTHEDLIRKYHLGELPSTRKAINTLNDGLTNTNQIMENYVTSITNTLDDLQNQIDGTIDQYFGSGVPSLSNYPANEWSASEYASHAGDLYYDRDTGKSYRFIINSSNNYEWQELVNSEVQQALALANAAKDTADSKRRIFVVQPTTPYDVGDIWWTQGEIYRAIISRQSEDSFSASDWINDLKYTDDTAANNAIAQLDAYKTEVQNTYVTSATFTTSNNAINATVQSVQASTDRKNTIFKNEPTTPYKVGDLYITGSNIYVCTTARETGEYNAEDWTLQLNSEDYATKAELTVTDNRITSSVSEINTLIETAQNTADDAVSQAGVAKDTSENAINTINEVKDYADDLNDQLTTYKQEVSTRFTQTADQFEMDFDTLTSQINAVSGTVSDNQNELHKYIRFVDGKIILGAAGNPIQLEEQNDRLSFKQNGIEIAYISDNQLYITEAYVKTSLKIGKFAFTPRSNGSLSFGKVSD